MAAKMGPLLKHVMGRMERAGPELFARERMAVAAHVVASEADDRLPLVVKAKVQKARRGESWPEYKERIGRTLGALSEVVSGGEAEPLYLANALAGTFATRQTVAMMDNDAVDMVELDPIVDPTLMDDAVIDVGLEHFRNHHGRLTGTGVTVAVLDSGVDAAHPHLQVADAVSTCGEDVALPGQHGTHCAGSIASRDPVFPGVAPDVSLINVKVLRADGSGRHTDIARGIDAALDRDAHVISMSLGFNHLPTWSDQGHGWACPDGRCPLCTAVDNAVGFGATAVVAAGNEHARAEALRRLGFGDRFDTELACPGQARSAISVGALSKRTFLPAEFSSRGPSAYGAPKPDLAGPGVNVMSTVPVPRRADGTVDADAHRAHLFGRLSGTSMATPIVSGVVALLIQYRREKGLPVTPAAIRQALLDEATTPIALPANVVGAGRVDLGRFGAVIPVS